MDELYRGHAINLTRAGLWHAVLIEIESGTILPTKATALMREGRGIAISRARRLVDLYVEAKAARSDD